MQLAFEINMQTSNHIVIHTASLLHNDARERRRRPNWHCVCLRSQILPCRDVLLSMGFLCCLHDHLIPWLHCGHLVLLVVAHFVWHILNLKRNLHDWLRPMRGIDILELKPACAKRM